MNGIAVGFGLGFFVALQVGPMSLFLVRSTLRNGLRVGLAIGAGIATIDALYASLGSAGAAPLLTRDPVRLALGLAGACTLLVIGVRTFWSAFHVRIGVDTVIDAANPRGAFAASVAGTASNPATIVSWAVLFAAASSATGVPTVPLVVGVALGSLGWVSVLACGVAAVRRGIGTRAMRVIDGVAGVGLLAFGGAMGYGTLHDSR